LGLFAWASSSFGIFLLSRLSKMLAPIYPSEFKSWEFDKEAAQIFLSRASGSALGHGASEDQKFVAKPTLSKTNF